MPCQPGTRYALSQTNLLLDINIPLRGSEPSLGSLAQLQKSVDLFVPRLDEFCKQPGARRRVRLEIGEEGRQDTKYVARVFLCGLGALAFLRLLSP